jgi:hypothetical protein
MSGKVFATAGEIGNWEVDANQNLKDNQNRIFLNPNLPGIELKTAGVTELKINAGGLTNLAGASINLSTISFTDTNNWSANTLINDTHEQSAGTFTVTGGTYTDTVVSFPTFYDVIYSNNRTGYINIYYGYRVYKVSDSSVVASGYISSAYWNGGTGEYSATLNGYNGYFSFTAPVEASTQYELKWFVEIEGYNYQVGGFGGDILTTSFNVTAPAILATKSVDVVELTNNGIQIATSATRYIKLERNSGASILSGQGNISLIGDSVSPILSLSGTTAGTAINIASGTGNIHLNNNDIIGADDIYWNSPQTNVGALTSIFSGGLTRPSLYLPNIPLETDIGGTQRGLQIRISSGTGLWYVCRNNSSSIRYKWGVKEWEHPSLLDAINNVKIKNFHWNVDKKEENPALQIGIIAEELEAAGLEEFVDYTDIDDPENPGQTKKAPDGIAKAELVFVLWKAVQELSQKVKDLENKLNS